MKKSFCFAFGLIVGFANFSRAQTNYFPSTGSVGIGTTSPGSNLEVYSPTNTTVNIRNEGYTSGYTQLRLDTKQFASPGNNAGLVANASGSDVFGVPSETFGIFSRWRPMIFAIGDGSGNTYERMRIQQNGKVGIGTNSPEAMLDVYQATGGSIRVRNDENLYGTAEVILEAKRLNGGNRAGMLANATNGTSFFGIPSGTFGIFSQWRPIVFAVGNGSGNTYEYMRITQFGSLLIGKVVENTSYKLDVNGKVRANEIVVNSDGSDFVFENDYNLLPLEEVEKYINENKHLPSIPPAKDMQENGMEMGDVQTKLLQKVEELTLYLIEQNKKLVAQQKIIEALNKRIQLVEDK